jgi:hypothetical protein
MKINKCSYEKKEMIGKVICFQPVQNVTTYICAEAKRLDSNLLVCRNHATDSKIDHREPAVACLGDAGAFVEHESCGGTARHDTFRDQSLFEGTRRRFGLSAI